MRKFSLISTLALFPLFIVLATGLRAQEAAQQQPAKRHRIAVLEFNDSGVSGAAQALFGRQVDVGKGVSDLLINRLLMDGTYRVTEPDQVEKILVEKNLSHSNLFDAQTAAKVGYNLGADAVVVGEITQFGRDDKRSGTEDIARTSPDSKGPSGGETDGAGMIVAITAEFVDANTGQVLITANAKGVSHRSGQNSPGSTDGNGGTPNAANMESNAFTQTLIGKATTAAVNELAKELEGEDAKLPRWAPPPLKGEITDASTPNVVINVGSAAGLKVGDQMLVTRLVHVVRERVANEPVGTVEDQVGELTITSVQPASAVGRFSGGETPKVGDLVRPMQ
ncbi:MAG TPA: CsgG/HfaB family protein [Terracidiphilus sp.]|nr:CsgG/HfaB family protein [Terracidiphilus sp.]